MAAVIPGNQRTTEADRDGNRKQSEQVRVVVSGEDTGGRYAVVETLERWGSEPPLHRHTREDELVYVLEGRVVFLIEGERLDLPEGTFVSLPRGREHTFRVESNEARLLVLLTPAGMDALYAELAESVGPLVGDPRPLIQDLDRLVSASARYGVEITGRNPLTVRGGDSCSG